MKNPFYIIMGLATICLTDVAQAECITYSSCSGCTYPVRKETFNCTTTPIYIGVSESSLQKALYEIDTCPSCPSGYKRVGKSITLSPSCTTQYYVCQEDCSAGCSDCTSTNWVALRTGYQSRTTATCACTTCTKNTEYRCAAGYYGTTANGTSGCTQCPTEDNATATSTAGSTSNTSCYIANGTQFSNQTGTGSWTGDSYLCD